MRITRKPRRESRKRKGGGGGGGHALGQEEGGGGVGSGGGVGAGVGYTVFVVRKEALEHLGAHFTQFTAHFTQFTCSTSVVRKEAPELFSTKVQILTPEGGGGARVRMCHAARAPPARFALLVQKYKY